MEGIMEIVLFIGFLYWIWPNLFIQGASRANKMVDIVTNRMFDAFNKLAPKEIQQNDSLSTITSLKRFSSEQRTRKILSREAETKARESQLYEIKEHLPPVSLPKARPLVGLTCYSCAPVSRDSLVNKTTKHLGLKNILYEYPAVTKNGFFHRTFAHLAQVYEAKTFGYKQVANAVLQDDRFQDAIEKTTIQQFQDSDNSDDEYYMQLLKNNERRARKLLKDMRSTMSDFLLKFTSWVLYKLLPCFLGAVVVHSGQIKMLKEAGKSGLPLIFLPMHRSHLDYVMISFILLNNSIQCPLIAAGDNLRIPIFGSLLRGLGAFYIKRRIDPVMGQKDHVYKALLQSYMNAGLKAKHNLEFFLEGGRTRTGKPLMPKYGIFSIVLDALMNGTIEDALLVPVSINYEKLVDGNFIREQLGQPKQMETFGSAMKAIWHVLNSNYGMVRVDFNQPFSFRELVKTFNTGKVQNNTQSVRKLRSNPSTTSLYGTDVVSDEYKHLVEKISRHVIYDCARSTTIMSTNAVAFLLLHKFRNGVRLEDLSAALDELRNELEKQQKDIGFSGDSLDVITYSIDILGPGLVRKEKVNNEDVIKPIAQLPNVIELNYYSNILTTFYALESVIAIALDSLDSRLGFVFQDDLVQACLNICDILQYEFIFCKPCQGLETAIINCIEDLIINKEIFLPDLTNSLEAQRGRRIAEQLFDESSEQHVSKRLTINDKEESLEYLKFVKGLLMPLIESYSVSAFCLDKIVGRPLLENDLVREIISEMRLQLGAGSLVYDESVSSDSIKNAFKLFQKWEILECHNQSKLRLYYLQEVHDDDQSVRDLCNKIDKYRYGFQV
ncbi:hypothetical protein ILUMI_05716 [Ignelater luminosus]|uniref:Phospholipid/glycerol acyltransferase domain-containing protein n=1 Tax=Ignelater luminosus TaxID=2038154 RepID=A0A8K0GHW1_IGNLU|nr:hypothetical protein ILUMI_05716 [Ignelater luminosus]